LKAEAQPFIITITGPESTGKSTLSAALAGKLHCPWRQEAARAYLENLGREYEEADLLRIHEKQEAQTESLCLQKPRFLVLDTDAQVMRGWSEIKYGRCATAILEALALRPPQLYLLPNIDLPWQPDSLREHPDPKDRRRLWRYYQEAVQGSGVPFIVLAGSPEEQLAQALQGIKQGAQER
jgi:nicotinamide riboside kinase